jgi:hypothetical protein
MKAVAYFTVISALICPLAGEIGFAEDACPLMYSWIGEFAGDLFGSESSTGIGDFNGDGYPDVAVSAPNYNNYSGRIYIYSGYDGTLLCIVDARNENDNIFALCGIGDRNNDDYDDFVMSASGYANGQPGKVYIFHGSAGPYPLSWNPDNAADSVVGPEVGDNLGFIGARLSDLDDDGYVDFAIHAAYFDTPGVPYVLVLSGKTLDTLFILTSPASDDGFGANIADAGDVDNDGTGDFLVGAPLYMAYQGAAYLFSGADGSLLRTYLNTHYNDYFGLAVDGAGDVNGDGFGDVVIGNPANDEFGNASGKGCIFAGSSGPYPDTVYADDADWSFHGGADDRLGRAVCGVGDINGDGKADVALGAFQYYTGEVGYVSVYSIEDGELLHQFYGQTPHGAFGVGISAIGDLNADGITEMLVGAPYRWDGGGEIPPGPGEAFVFTLGTIDTDGDGVYDQCDVCPGYDDTVDDDSDGLANGCDNCPDDYNPDQSDMDDNGVGDACQYVCGDASGDDAVNIGDAVHIINYIFKGGPAPDPLCSGDADGDDAVNIGDAVHLINYIFKGGPPPVEPCCP